MKNKFFELALTQAATLLGKPGRIARLVGQLSLKLKRSHFQSVNRKAIQDQFMLIGRLIKAQALGKYSMKSYRFLIILIAAILYFVNPIDLIPDFVIGIGLTDDLAILTWVFNAAADEINAFKAWEATHVPTSASL